MRLFCQLCYFRKSFGSFRTYRTSTALYKIVQFNLSDIGEGIREVTVRDWYVKVGDKVAQFDNVCLVESDKASVSITSRFDGTIKKLYYDIGETALVGTPLVDIDVESEASSEVEQSKIVYSEVSQVKGENYVEGFRKEEDAQNKRKEDSPSSPSRASDEKSDISNLSEINLGSGEIERALATPAVRRIAKENNISLSSVKASGRGGRVLKEDILRHLGELPSDNKEVPSFIAKESNTSLDRKVEITGIKKAMVKTMTKSSSIPTFGYCDEVDMTALIELRNEVKDYAAKKGINFTYMPFFIKALSKSLEEFPELNASVDDNCEYITYKAQHNIGLAMDTEKGLIVPNIKNVQNLNVLEIGVHLARLLELGRTFRLGPSDMTGGTITVSNIGIIGGTYLRPLILPPEVCILALGKVNPVPKFNSEGIIVKKFILNASWAADHRVIDGATLAKFSNTWKEYIENPNFLLMNL